MTWALIVLASSLVVWSVTLTIWWRRADSERDSALLLFNGEHAQHIQTRHELEVEQHNVTLLRDELDATKALLTITEKQRDNALREAHDYFVHSLQSAKPSEAAKVLANLLAGRLDGGVLPEAPRSASTTDYLLDPSKT